MLYAECASSETDITLKKWEGRNKKERSEQGPVEFYPMLYYDKFHKFRGATTFRFDDDYSRRLNSDIFPLNEDGEYSDITITKKVTVELRLVWMSPILQAMITGVREMDHCLFL